MNEQAKKLAESVGLQPYYTAQEQQISDFYMAVVQQCAKYLCDHYPHSRYEVAHMRRHMGDPDWNKSSTTTEEEPQHIGYTEREEGFYKLYAPPNDGITTQAFILCKYCSGAIYHCGGPKSVAVCFDCYKKDPELR